MGLIEGGFVLPRTAETRSGTIEDVTGYDETEVNFTVAWFLGDIGGNENKRVRASWTDIDVALLQGELVVRATEGMEQKPVEIKISSLELSKLTEHRPHMEDKGTARLST